MSCLKILIYIFFLNLPPYTNTKSTSELAVIELVPNLPYAIILKSLQTMLCSTKFFLFITFNEKSIVASASNENSVAALMTSTSLLIIANKI